MDWRWLLTSFDGRINRGKFWAGVALLIAAQIASYMLIGTVFGYKYVEGSNLPRMGPLSGLATFLVGIALLYCSLAVYTKRWHDRDKSGWWSLILLIPVIGGIWLLVECGCLVGTQGPNRFGPDPLAGGG